MNWKKKWNEFVCRLIGHVPVFEVVKEKRKLSYDNYRKGRHKRRYVQRVYVHKFCSRCGKEMYKI